MKKVVRRNAPAPDELDEDYVARLGAEFQSTKEAVKTFTERAEKLKGELTKYVIDHGLPDENGSLWLEVGDLKLKRERRISRFLDVDAATKWAEEQGLWEEVSEVIPEHRELSEDKLLGLAWDKAGDDVKLVQTIQSFYVEREQWAFRA